MFHVEQIQETAMHIKRIRLMEFRNYRDIKLELKEGINVLYGDNGSGKTNILESIYWLSTGKSFRISEDKAMIFHGKENTKAEADIVENDIERIVSIELSKSARQKKISLNNSRIRKRSELSGIMPVVVFSPENIMMIKGEPALRRKFIDDMIFQIDSEYAETIIKYQKEVSHRNFLLKKIRENKAGPESLKVWNEQITEKAIILVKKRIQYIDKLIEIINSDLIPGEYDINIKYRTKNEYDPLMDNLKEYYYDFFKQNQYDEITRGSTLIGPHRDDMDVMFDNKESKLFASEGQQRITTVMLKLGEGLLIRDTVNIYPVVLLDDFSSELDDSNRNLIGHTFKNFKQIIITTTHKDNLKGFTPAAEFFISSGDIR